MLACSRITSREWISVSGLATLSRDRDTIHDLYEPDWKIWFADEGSARNGSADGPRLVLIGVQVHAATFLTIEKPQPVVLFELVKGRISDDTPDLGEVHHVGA